MLIRFAAAIAAVVITTSAIAQEFRVGSIKIELPWIRATPTGAKVAGGFMRIENTGTVPDRLIGGSVAVDLGVPLVEARARGGQCVQRDRPVGRGIERRAQLVTLARVAKVELAREPRVGARHAFRRKLGTGVPLQLREDRLGVRGRNLRQRTQLRADVIVHHVRAQQAQS